MTRRDAWEDFDTELEEEFICDRDLGDETDASEVLENTGETDGFREFALDNQAKIYGDLLDIVEEYLETHTKDELFRIIEENF